jgi:adenylate kinase family enzyme
MDVFHFANSIYDSEIYVNPFLKEQKNIIMCSAIIHDMCDKKYMNESIGILNMNEYMRNYLSTDDLNMVNNIVSSMSYSTVKKNGFPDLQNYNLAYHIVREADLLSGYDFERCVIYQMMHNGDNYITSLSKANEVFQNRILEYKKENLFITDYSKNMANILHDNAIQKMEEMNAIYNKYNL